MWNTLPSGTARFNRGATAHTSTSASRKAVQPVRVSSGPGGGSTAGMGACPPASAASDCSMTVGARSIGCVSGFGTAALDREQALRTLLDEDHDQDQHRDLGEHGAGPAFDELVEDAQAERGVHRARQL